MVIFKMIIIDLTADYIVSIDIRIKHFAYCVLFNDKIVEWKSVQLDLEGPGYRPKVFIDALKTRLGGSKFLPCSHVFIERQMNLAPGGGIGAFQHLTNLAIEALLYATCEAKFDSVSLVAPTSVDKFWAALYPEVHEPTPKKTSITWTMKCIEDGKVSFGDGLLEMFHQSRKKDDLADCLLQAIYAASL